ncbi:hypothetical protein ACVWYS_002832 [Arthrobacter sp. TE12231]
MNDFENELRNNIALRAAGESEFQLYAFADELAERLEAAEVVFDVAIEPLRCTGRRGRVLEILGYAEDHADDSLVVIVGLHYDEPGRVLTMTDAKRIFASGASFLEHAADGWLTENLEPSSRESEHASYFAQQLKRADRLKFILVTDGTMSQRIQTIPTNQVCEKAASYTIWDVRRFEELSLSESGRDELEIDLTRWMPDGLPCLVGAQSGEHAKSYLAVLPGKLLAEVFQEFGSQLLESNVRTFLSARGKVNKGIQYTLAHEPEMFLAYNNGLTTTATDIDVVTSAGSVRIRSIRNWQIVNGGQTTSSLLYFLKQQGRELDDVFVQMKLVTVDADQAGSLVANISRFANSQNKVSEADFFSNSEFHVRLEQISRRLKAPAQEGEQYQTRWFYERTRGQYENTRNGGSASEKRKFDLEYPKRQKVTKTDWAKYAFSWSQKPHLVSRGAQSNFTAYAVLADKAWGEKPDEFGDAYFRTNIAKAIMYNELRSSIVKEPWQGTGYLANVVTYAMSKFSYEVERQFPGSKFDFEAVWQRQKLSKTTLDTLISTARAMHGVLTDEDRPQDNVTQWAKQEACWNLAKLARTELPDELASDLIAGVSLSSRQAEARKQRRMDTGFEMIERMLNVAPHVWEEVLSEGRHAGVISPTDRDIILTVARRKLVPTERQAARLLSALEKCASMALISRADF